MSNTVFRKLTALLNVLYKSIAIIFLLAELYAAEILIRRPTAAAASARIATARYL